MMIKKMKIKKLISLLTATATAITALTGAMSVSATNSSIKLKGEVLKGKCGESADWLINSDGVLVISGTGEMSAYADNQSTDWGWRKYGYYINKIVIENGITSTNTNSNSSIAFINTFLPNVSSIIIPPSFIKLKKTLEFVSYFKNLKDIYIYSKNVTDVETGSEVIWHVYKDSDTEKSLRSNGFEKIEYIPDNEQMPTVSNKTPVEMEPITDTSGPSGTTSKYEYNESSKTLTFSGKGEISIADNYQKYAKETEHIVIESGITKIFASTGVKLQECISGAFYGFTALNDVQLPNTLTEIGELSFYETPLTNINFPEGLEQIGTLAFYNTNLEDISFPNSLKEIGERSFQNTKIKSINLHGGMGIGGGAFTSCISLKEITIPNNITFYRTNIGGKGMSREQATFSDCKGLEKIIIEDGCWLGDSWNNEITPNGIPALFCSECPSLKTVVIKGNVEYIGSAAFLARLRLYNYSSLADIYFYNTGLKTITPTSAGANTISIDCSNDPTFHVVKGSQTEQTLRDAGYLTANNTKYVPNITDLQSAIDEAEKIDTSKYTNNTLINNLKTALENAKSVINNLDATQVNVDAAVKALNDAISALNPKTSVPTSPTSKVSPTTRNPETVKKDKAAAEKLMQQAKITQLKVKSKSKKKINVSWKKVKNAVGYQVQVSKKKNFKKNKIIFNKFTSKKKLTISKKIKSKKTYFVRVRAYATYKDTYGKPQKVYSKWNNKLRKVKVK